MFLLIIQRSKENVKRKHAPSGGYIFYDLTRHDEPGN